MGSGPRSAPSSPEPSLPGVWPERVLGVPAGLAEQLQVGLDHHRHQLLEADLWLPAELIGGLGRVRAQLVYLGGPDEGGVGDDVVPPVEAHHGERQLHQLANAVRNTGPYHEVSGLVPHDHQVHRAHEVAGEPPVPAGAHVAQAYLLLVAELDFGATERHLTGDELCAPARRLVIEQDAGHGEHPVRLAVVLGQVVAVGLGHAVGAARVEWGLLGLRRLPHLPEHLRGRRLVEPDLTVPRTARPIYPAADPDRLEYPEHAEPGDLAGELS